MSDSPAQCGIDGFEPHKWPESWAECLYRFLDNRVVHAEEGDWQIQVYVTEDGQRIWIQTAAVGETVCPVLLRVDSLADPLDTVAALESWLAVPSDNHVIDIMPRAH